MDALRTIFNVIEDMEGIKNECRLEESPLQGGIRRLRPFSLPTTSVPDLRSIL